MKAYLSWEKLVGVLDVGKGGSYTHYQYLDSDFFFQLHVIIVSIWNECNRDFTAYHGSYITAMIKETVVRTSAPDPSNLPRFSNGAGRPEGWCFANVGNYLYKLVDRSLTPSANNFLNWNLHRTVKGGS